MFAKVIPFAKLPRKLECFDYSVPREFEDKIKIGHIVAIYFRGQKIPGLVEEISNETKVLAEKIKPVAGLTEMVLPKNYIKLIRWAGERYMASPALFYKFFVPSPAVSRAAPDAPLSKNLLLNQKQAGNALAALKNFSTGNNIFFLYENDPKETIAAFIKLAQRELKNKKQVLVLAPAIEDVIDLSPFFHSIFKEKLIIWRGKMPAGEKFSLWQKISAGGSLVILGTRPAVFLPFSNLSLILINNCASPDLKQWDQNPRYDSRETAEKLHELYGAKIIKSDVLPDLTAWKDLRGGKMTALNSREPAPHFTIADIKKEKNISAQIYTFPLHQMIARGLEQNKKIILFLNRREKKSLLFCPDCRKTFSCPECSRPYGIDGGQFLCYNCGRKNPVPAECPDCRGTNLKTLSAGMENIKKIISKEFSSAKIEIAAKENFQPQNFDILIATDYFWKNFLKKIDLSGIYGAAIVDFDFYLLRPEFNQKEIALLALERFLRFAAVYNISEALVQTAFPENEIFSDADKFYGNELRERQELGYPPFGQLIKIICKEKDEVALDNESRKLYEKLLNSGFNALPPFPPLIKKRTKNYLKHIILKENLNKNLSNLKNIVPDEYQIDVNPISIY